MSVKETREMSVKGLFRELPVKEAREMSIQETREMSMKETTVASGG